MTKLLVDRALLEQAVAALQYLTDTTVPMTGQQQECWPSLIVSRNALRAALDAPEVEPPWEAAERVDNGGQP